VRVFQEVYPDDPGGGRLDSKFGRDSDPHGGFPRGRSTSGGHPRSDPASVFRRPVAGKGVGLVADGRAGSPGPARGEGQGRNRREGGSGGRARQPPGTPTGSDRNRSSAREESRQDDPTDHLPGLGPTARDLGVGLPLQAGAGACPAALGGVAGLLSRLPEVPSERVGALRELRAGAGHSGLHIVTRLLRTLYNPLAEILSIRPSHSSGLSWKDPSDLIRGRVPGSVIEQQLVHGHIGTH
jgi:hypothetical protein